jgi:endonuclease-3 related protein
MNGKAETTMGRGRSGPENRHHDQVPRTLRDVYSRLRSHFGYATPWWPGTPLEITIGALLVQRCNWSAAWSAVGRLRGAGLVSLPALAGASPQAIEDGIRGVSFPGRKATRLIRLARSVLDRGHCEVESYLSPSHETTSLRDDLLALDGIGSETADCILLFASEHPHFIIDEYTRRVFRRLDIFPESEIDVRFWSRPYDLLQTFFEDNILDFMELYGDFEFAPGVLREVALLRDFHAQLVELGRHHCLKSSPRCRTRGVDGWQDYPPCESHCRTNGCRCCPLIGVCKTARGDER